MAEQESGILQREQLARLALNLRELEDCYRGLLGMLRVRREQVGRGEIKVLHEGMEDERICLQKIAALDEVRAELVRELTGARAALIGGEVGEASVEVANGMAMSIDAVMPLAEGGVAEELRSARTALRTMLELVQAEYAVLQQVGEALFSHVSSLIKRIRTLGTNASIYGRNGRVNGYRPMVTGVDLRT